jgi:hypothetical protein
MTPELRPKTAYMCLSIDGFMRNNKFPRNYDLFEREDGSPMSPEEAAAFLATEKAKGRKVIPTSNSCSNPCKRAEDGCAGFDYSGGGCPGYYCDSGKGSAA